MKGVRLWDEVLHCVFSSRRVAGSLDIIADDSFAGVVILTEYFQASITAAITERLKVQSLQETGGACLSVSTSDATNESSSPTLESFETTGGCS